MGVKDGLDFCVFGSNGPTLPNDIVALDVYNLLGNGVAVPQEQGRFPLLVVLGRPKIPFCLCRLRNWESACAPVLSTPAPPPPQGGSTASRNVSVSRWANDAKVSINLIV